MKDEPISDTIKAATVLVCVVYVIAGRVSSVKGKEVEHVDS